MMDDILQIPSPSQMDDWALYNRIIGDDIRQREGDVAYSTWKNWQETLEKEREMAQSESNIQEEFQRYSLTPQKE
jgi:hypothetical protein